MAIPHILTKIVDMKVERTLVGKEEIYRSGKGMKGVMSSKYAHSILYTSMKLSRIKKKIYKEEKREEVIHQPPEHFRQMRDLYV